MADNVRRDVPDDERDKHLPDPPGQARLVHLDEVKGEFKVADHDPDIRGWDVRSSDGRNIGKVEDLIVDTGMMKVRYMEVKIDKDAVGGEDDRYVVLPIGEARLDDNEDDVYVNLDAASVASLPTYDPDRFDRDDEKSLRNRFTATNDATTTTGSAAGVGGLGAAAAGLGTGNRVPGDDDFYAHQSYDEGRLFGKRRAGRENESYIRLNEERLDADKRVVPTEEVVIRKKVVRDDEVVEADLQEERLAVDDDKSRRRPEDRV